MVRFICKLLFISLLPSQLSFGTDSIDALINQDSKQNKKAQDSSTPLVDQNLSEKIAQNKKSNSKLLLLQLPDEIFLRVAFTLSPQDNGALGSTCRRLAQITNDNCLWHQYYTDLPQRNIGDHLNYDALKPEDFKNLVQQYYLHLKMFILDIQGKGKEAQLLLTKRFPKLSYTNYVRGIGNKIVTVIEKLDYIHHDACEAYEDAEDIKNYISKDNAYVQIKKIEKIINRLLVQRHFHVVENYLIDVRKEFANQQDKNIKTAKFLSSNGLENCNSSHINIFEINKIIENYEAGRTNICKAHIFIDELIAEGGQSGDAAIKFKFEGLYFDDFGYQQDKALAHQIIYDYYNNKYSQDFWIEMLQIRNQLFQFVSCQSNINKDDNTKKNNLISKKLKKINNLLLYNDDPKNREEAKKLLEELMAINYEPAFSQYFHDILWNHGSTPTREENSNAVNWLEDKVIKKQEWAIRTKLFDLCNHHIHYDFNEVQAKEFIEQQCVVNNIEAILFKSLGLGYGLYGYDRDVPAAIEFIKKWKLHPFVLETNLHLLRQN